MCHRAVLQRAGSSAERLTAGLEQTDLGLSPAVLTLAVLSKPPFAPDVCPGSECEDSLQTPCPQYSVCGLVNGHHVLDTGHGHVLPSTSGVGGAGPAFAAVL